MALTIAAGFASASFAQGTTPAPPPATPAAPGAPAAAENKIEAPKAVEPAKMEAAKTEAPKADTGTPAEKYAKSKGHKRQANHEKAEGKTEVKQKAKPATTPAPVAK